MSAMILPKFFQSIVYYREVIYQESLVLLVFADG